jgi:hypothetical protein
MLEITRLAKNPYSLGILARYLANAKPFSELEFGPTILSVLHQINDETHLVATRDDRIVGYLGWLRAKDDVARAWLEHGGRLEPDAQGDAIAVTIFLADRPDDILPIFKAAKRAAPGKSVYWKRYFSDGRAPSPRQVRKK